jgi:pSer/pThr/pTyr-binding forkhead associated (FHA) protein
VIILLYLCHINSQQYYEIREQITIGRTSGDIVCPEDGRMSGKHAQVSVETDGAENSIYVEDLGSKNFTIVNRAEIHPNQKTKIKIYNLLEIGDQQFVVTDTKEVKLNDLNEMIKRHLSRSILKINLEVVHPGPLAAPVEIPPFELLKIKEAQILQLQNDILLVEQGAESELLKLEEAKEKVIVKAKSKKAEMIKVISALQLAVERMKEEMLKVKAEIELKKKKIINLKDLPTDSTEELPE